MHNVYNDTNDDCFVLLLLNVHVNIVFFFLLIHKSFKRFIETLTNPTKLYNVLGPERK